jgi:hypothetical protein
VLEDELVGVCTIQGGIRHAYEPFQRQKRIWQSNVKMDLSEIKCEGVNSIQLAQDGVQWRAFVNALMNLLVS